MSGGTEDMVVVAINAAKLASKAAQKVQHLGEVHELLVKGEPALLEAFLPELLDFQVDKAASVRRRLVELLAAAVEARGIAPGVISHAAPALAALLQDEHVPLAKHAALAAHAVLRAGLAARAAAPRGDDAAAAAACAARQLADTARGLAAGGGDVGLRVACIKLAEQAALVFTGGAAAGTPDAAALGADAAGLVAALGGLLAPPAAQPGPVTICAIKALATLCAARDALLGGALPPLLELATQVRRAPRRAALRRPRLPRPGAARPGRRRATPDPARIPPARQGVLKAPAPGDGQSGVAASCGAALRDVLARLLRGNAEPLRPWQARLDGALRAMGADAVADSAQRHIERQAARARAEKRKAEQQGGPEAKHARGVAFAGADSSIGDTPARTPTPTPMLGGGQHGGGDMLAALLPGGLSRTADPTTDVQRVLEALVASQQAQAVEMVLAQLPPEVLSELVLRWMDNLPAKPTSDVPQPAAVAGVPDAALGGPMALVGQAPAAALFAAAAQQQQAVAAAPVDPRRRAAAGAAVAAARRPAAGAAGAAPPPGPLPLSLSDRQVAGMRQAAVQRILAADKSRPIRHFRELLLSRLVAQAPQADGLADLVLQYVLTDFHGRRGHVLVVRWLYALAAALAARAGGDGGGGGGGGGARRRSPPQQQQQQQQQQQHQEQQQQQQQPEQGGAGEDAPMADGEPAPGGAAGGGSPGGQRRGSDGAGGGGDAPDLAGTEYEAVLLELLRGLRRTLPSTDGAIARLLADAPVLPVSPTLAFLAQLLDDAPDWAALALGAADALMEGRPPLRRRLLRFALDAAVRREAPTREAAVNLVVRQLKARPAFEDEVVCFARQQLLLLLEPRKLMALELQQQQEQQQPAQGGAAAAPAAGRGQPAVKPEEQAGQAEQQAGQAAQAGQGEQAAQGEGQQQPGGQAEPEAEPEPEPEPELDVEVAATRCMLYMAPRARALGPADAALLALVAAPPPGARHLLLTMLAALAESAAPSPPLVAAARAHFEATGDVQLLAAVATGLRKAEAARLLPHLVAQLDRPQLRAAFRKLTSRAGDAEPLFKPTELLVALHQLKPAPPLRLTTKQQTAALDVALHAPEVFPVAVVVQAIRRLEALTPLPQLFMRTVITALQISPKLTDTVMELLKRLITKQVWTSESQWRGFLIAAEKAAPASYPVLLTLPPSVLEAALGRLPERHWRELLRYATGPECAVPVFQPVRDVLAIFLDRLAARTKEKAAAAAAGAGAAAANGEPSAAGGAAAAQPPPGGGGGGCCGRRLGAAARRRRCRR
ncbi:hypothetical protein HT031_000150 [Scenedesmus sp. PABB004]|nr:hypothetical protein HT031_000150 [Scenedesmus sp. PABB004]